MFSKIGLWNKEGKTFIDSLHLLSFGACISCCAITFCSADEDMHYRDVFLYLIQIDSSGHSSSAPITCKMQLNCVSLQPITYSCLGYENRSLVIFLFFFIYKYSKPTKRKISVCQGITIEKEQFKEDPMSELWFHFMKSK